ncbi:hypothetical protein CLOM_g3806, partial [Closterium sp. NIES-68]
LNVRISVPRRILQRAASPPPPRDDDDHPATSPVQSEEYLLGPACSARCEPPESNRYGSPPREPRSALLVSDNPFSHAALVCRRWLAIARFAVLSIRVTDSESESNHLCPRMLALSLSRGFPNLTRIHLRGLHNVDFLERAFLRPLADFCPRLECLDIAHVPIWWPGKPEYKHGAGDNGLEYLFLRCTRLQDVRLGSIRDIALLPYSLLALPRLRVLHLRAPDLQEVDHLKHGEEIRPITSYQLSSSLQELDLSCCTSLQFPETFLSLLPGLKKLSLGRGSPLVSFPPSLPAHLHSLSSLSFTSCSQLTALPDYISLLSSLVHCEFVDCQRLQHLPPTFPLLPRLQRLLIANCGSFSALPDSIELLTSLRRLEVSACRLLFELPDSFTGLSNLECLEITACENFDRFPPAVRSHFSALTHLHLSGLPTDLNLPGLLSQMPGLEIFHLHHYDRHSLAHSLNSLSSLLSLHLETLPRLVSLPPDFTVLSRIQALHVVDCESLSSLPSLLPPSLTLLSISCCPEISALPPCVSSLTSLHSLSIRYCSSMLQLPPTLTCLTSLTSISLAGCSALKSIPTGLWELPRLQLLDVEGGEAVGGMTTSVSLQRP